MNKSLYPLLLVASVAQADLHVTVQPGGQAQPQQHQIPPAQLAREVAASSDVAQVFASTPGVALQSGGGVSALPVIHGLADDRIRIKVDGMDLISACGNHMNPPLSYISANAIGQAQVFAGISPVSMGGDSIAGTIVVDSSAPRFAPAGQSLTQGEVGFFYRSNGEERGGNIDLSTASAQFSANYQASTAKADNYTAGRSFKAAGPAAAGRGKLAGDEVGSSYYQSTHHLLGLAMLQGQHLWQLKLGLQDIPEQGWANQRMDMTGNDSQHINLSYQGRHDWGELKVRAYHEKTEHSMQFGRDKLFWYGAPGADGTPCTPSGGMAGCAAGMPMDTEGENSGVSVKANWQLNHRDTVRLGLEGQQYRLDDRWEPSGRGMWPNTFVNINDGERDRLAAFAQWDARWNTAWHSQLGLRVEQLEMDAGPVQGYNAMMANYAAESAAFNSSKRKRSDDNLDLTALLRYTPDEHYNLDIGYAQKTRSPNLYERYSWSTGGMVMRMINLAGDGNGYVGNLQLEPEIAHTLRTRLQWQQQDLWRLSLAPHYTYVDDYIDVVRCQSGNMNCGAGNQTASNQFVYLQYRNHSAQLYGADLSAQRQLLKHARLGTISGSAAISYVRGKNKTSHDSLYNIMPLNAQLALQQQRGAWTHRLELEWVDDKDKVSAVRNELKTDDYHLLHLRSAYQAGAFKVNFGVENLLDKFYELPLGGAYTGQGKTMPGNTVAWGTALPGRGRSFYTRVAYQF